MASQPIAWTSKNAWVSKLKPTKSHGTMISRLISRTMNTHPMQQTMKGSLSDTWPVNFSWVEKSCRKWNHDSTLLRCVDVSEANHLMEEMHEGLLGAYASGPCWPTRSWEPVITGSPWKTIALNMWGHATVAKPIKIRRTLLLSLCILWQHHGPSQPGIWMSSNPWFWKLQMVMSTS